MPKTPIILDTDPGVDDAMAIAYALAHPDIDVLALTTVFGNTRVDATTRNALWLLDSFGAADIPVARGLAVPSVQQPGPHSEHVHGADGIGNRYPREADGSLAAAARQAHALPAPQYIVDSARQRPGEITLVAVGPLTNIAAALALEPALPSLVRSLVVMGGALDEPGNVTPAAEANFFNDPHAVDAVMAADWPLTVVGLDVTHRIMLTESDLERIGRQGGKSGQLVHEASQFYLDFYATNGAGQAHADVMRCCAMHDAAAIAYVAMPDAFEVVSGVARTVPEGMAAGQLLLDRAPYAYVTDYWNNRPLTAVCVSTDAPRVLEDFMNRVIDWGGSA